ncbi:hypothetical protein [Sphingomonas sp.]|uniref:hypothetical protein n=1 Tax=Sphingomonas sp. TaxID=28214 RepID=UPI0038A9F1A5
MSALERIILALSLPIGATILWQVATFKWGFDSLMTMSPLFFVVVIAVGAMLIALGPWKPWKKVLILAAYVALEYVGTFVAALGTACAIGPCM